MIGDDVRKIIEQCVKEQSPIMIKYNGGTQPGTKRWILPLSRAGAQVRARDVSTDKAKMFSLSKIEIVDDRDPAENYVEKVEKKSTLVEALQEKVAELEALGWRVVLNDESIDLGFSYKRLGAAVDAFLKQARLYAPRSR
jgi:hypothetical protein